MKNTIRIGLALAALLCAQENFASDATTQQPSDEAPATTLPSVHVTAPHPVDPGSMQKLDGPPETLPVTIDTVTGQAFKDNGGTKVQDLATMVPGVSAASHGPETSGEALLIRGFLSEGVAVNGVRRFNIDGLGGYNLANIERFEILKGSAGLEAGSMDPGGVLNLVTKKPRAHPFYQVDLDGASYDSYGITGDATAPLGGGWSYRFVGNAKRDSGFRPYTPSYQTLLAPSLQYDYAPGSRVLAEVSYSKQDTPSDPGIFYVRGAGLPGNFADSRFFNSQPGGHQTQEDVRGAIYWTQQLQPGTDLRLALEQQRRSAHFSSFEPYMSDFYQGGVNNSLDYSGNSQTYLNLVDIRSCACDNRSGQLDLSHHWQIADIAQQTLAGVFVQRDFQKKDTEAGQVVRPFDVFNPDYSGDSSNDYLQPASDPNSLSSVFSSRAAQDGIYVMQKADGARWHAVAGVRSERLTYSGASTDNQYIDPAQDYSFTYRRRSWRVGGVYDLAPETFVHLGYSNAYQPNMGFDINGHPLAPMQSKGAELGVQSRPAWLHGKATLTIYQINQLDVPAPDPNDPTGEAYLLRGAQRSRGAEFSVSTHPITQWRFFAQASYTDARITKDDTGLEGKQTRSSPYASGTVDAQYQLPNIFSVPTQADMEYVMVGARPGDDANRFKLPGYSLLNAMLRFKLSSQFVLRMRVENLLDKTYYTYAGSHPWYIGVGRPRYFMMQISWQGGSVPAESDDDNFRD